MTRPYRYVLPPLRHPSNQIRLLRLLPGDESEDIHLSFSIHGLDEVPEYNAISYTWGELEDNGSVVYIDEEPFPVRNNCHYALWQARLHHPGEYVWIDAICTNQADDEEKSSQVSILGEIFAKATQVMACVGSHADDSEYLLECGFEDFDTWQDMSAQERRAWLDAKGEGCARRGFNASHSLSDRPYWKRVWVVQEVAVATHRVVLCGNSCLLWNTVDLCGHNLRGGLYGKTIQDAGLRVGDDEDSRAPPPSRLVANTSTAHAEAGSLSLETIISRFGSHKCSDPRDHIYGLLALIKWPVGAAPLRPDYSLTGLQLAEKILQLVTIEYTLPVVKLLQLSPNEPSVLAAIQRRRMARPDERGYSAPTQDVQHLQLGNVQILAVEQICNARIASGTLDATRQVKGPSPLVDWIFKLFMEDYQEAIRIFNETIDGDPSGERRHFEGRIPQLLTDGQNALGVLCSEARIGDFVAAYSANLSNANANNPGWHLGLVLRSRDDDSNICTIIGQAIVMTTSSEAFSQLNKDENRVLEADFDTTLTEEDMAILAAQDSNQIPIEPYAKIERLATYVNDYNANGPAFARMSNIRRLRGPNNAAEQITNIADL